MRCQTSTYIQFTGGGAGPFSVTCDWPFLKSVICEKQDLTLRFVTEVFYVMCETQI